MSPSRALALFVTTALVPGCPLVLGVGDDYGLAPRDASVAGDGGGLVDSAIDRTSVENDGGDDGGSDQPDGGPDGNETTPEGGTDAPFDTLPPYPPSPDRIFPCGLEIETVPPSDAGSICSGTPGVFECCYPKDSGLSAFCNSTLDSCNGSKIRCDDREDCSGGACCVTLNGDSTVTAECGSACAIQSCRTHAECGGGACVAWPCPEGPIFATCNRAGFDPSYCFSSSSGGL